MVELCLRADEGASVVPDRFVAQIGILGEDCVDRADQDHDDLDQSENGVVENEDNAHDGVDDLLEVPC